MSILNIRTVQEMTSAPSKAANEGTVKQTEQKSKQAVEEKAELDRSKLESAVEEANKISKSLSNRHLDFSVDDKTDTLIVKVVDNATGEVVRQMPPEEMLRLVEHFDKLKALLFSKKY